MIKIKHKGNFNKLEKFFIRMSRHEYLTILEKYGQLGVEALSSATPSDSGETAASWNFEIEWTRTVTTLRWTNTSSNDGAVVVILLQYGHGTGTGGYVQGRDFINPALKPIFDEIANEAWKEVTQ
jgi:hypothetical protein